VRAPLGPGGRDDRPEQQDQAEPPEPDLSRRDVNPETSSERMAALEQLAEELRRDADEVEQAPLLPKQRLRRLSSAGLLEAWVVGHVPPDPRRSLPAEPAERRVGAELAGACGPTFFVWSQQLTPLRRLEAAATTSSVAKSWLERLRNGNALAAISFAWLRRPGPPAISAQPAEDGFVIDGEADWVTGWGLADVLLAAAVDQSSSVHWLLVPFGADDAPPGLSVATQALIAMGATGTVRVRFERVHVPHDHELGEEPLHAWRELDSAKGRQPSTGALGIATEAIRRLAQRGDRDSLRAAEALGSELRTWRWRASELDAADQADATVIAARDAERARGIDLALRATAAFVSASGGSAMRAGHPAGRLAREALFYVVQAQGPAARSATLQALSAPRPPAPSIRPAQT